MKTQNRETSFPIPAAGHAEDLMFMMDVPNMKVENYKGGENSTLWEILHSPSENPYPPKDYMIQMAGIFINHWASIIKVRIQSSIGSIEKFFFVKIQFLERKTRIFLGSVHSSKHELC